MAIFLHGLQINNFRGIGSDGIKMEKFLDFNIFIGENNSGKSTILEFIYRILPFLSLDSSGEYSIPSERLQDLDYNFDSEKKKISASVAIDIISPIKEQYYYNEELQEKSLTILNKTCFRDGFSWLQFEIPSERRNGTKLIGLNAVVNKMSKEECETFPGAGGEYVGGDYEGHLKNKVKDFFSFVKSLKIPTVYKVSAMRRINKNDSLEFDFDGNGLVKKLFTLSNYSYSELQNGEKFRKINKLLSEVTGCSDAEIKVPYTLDQIEVVLNRKHLPLSSLGTGIEHIILIGVACTITDDSIICLEEPEIHLHPTLQKRLIDFLQKNTSNQYFIATHSPSFIDVPNAAIFHVWQETKNINIREAILNLEKFNICRDLGCKASDILQANSVIWVEGPSELIYLRFWLKSVDASLIEGIHYSIMFYGGRLLSHLSGDDVEDLEDFIQLPKLNRNSAIIMDSDKDDEAKSIGAHKLRVQNEFEKNGGFVWITTGREIENYLPHSKIQEALKNIHPQKYKKESGGGIYEHAFYFERNETKKDISEAKTGPYIEKNPDKVAISKWISSNTTPDFSILDLHDYIKKLSKFIRQANGMHGDAIL